MLKLDVFAYKNDPKHHVRNEVLKKNGGMRLLNRALALLHLANEVAKPTHTIPDSALEAVEDILSGESRRTNQNEQ